MSASILKKSLLLVDPSISLNNTETRSKSKNLNKNKHIQKPKQIIQIDQYRKQVKTNKDIYNENLNKIKKIKEATKINIDKTVTQQIILRNLQKRPVRLYKKKKSEDNKTEFTEEDFAKFAEEYTGE